MHSLTFNEAIKESTRYALEKDKSVIVIGEGVPDPKAIFGTTKGLQEEFGSDTVFDMPVSENALTGVCIGAAITGLKPILVHQRIDFTLYSFDQIVNNAAKWHSMFGGQAGNVPMVIRAIVGRGWGAGNQHSQNLAHLYAMIPGLKVVAPSNARDAFDMLWWAINDPNPVIFVEHRWLQNTESYFYDLIPRPIEGDVKANVVNNGDALTLVSWSYMTIEAIKVARLLKDHMDIDIEVVDMRSLSPLDIDTVKESVKKTRGLLVLEEAWRFNSLSSEIITQLFEDDSILMDKPRRITLPDCYAPSSHHMSKYYYPRAFDIVLEISKMLKLDQKKVDKMLDYISWSDHAHPHDVPDNNFRGPF